ncbi:4Fe-4S binding protein [Snuella sedimenti]|uniref:4Fe-4S binding protein n=1 Tax=Snuella sedimenti TaxID=2798802 RepID=A0A8J7IM92_9FLAO|nr:4Fe-4S binding protein [Snuella sedimenti]MBJ6367047.1 4Fe-4S binding protein [Snuella sedimenti]
MKTPTYNILNANQVVAHIAYKTNEVFPIYPITPASEMAELVEQWAAKNKTNSFGHTPSVFQMQSEVGVAGAMHGALQTGALSNTFTASQGLLLMLPNMFKIAGELTPNVIHVATRSIATHALSIFGDHSDVMAIRQSGYAILGSASVQEAQDLALIAQAASLQSKIPFVHFFDGFRTSHELTKIETITDATIAFMLDHKAIKLHQNRALTPEAPILKGSSQASDVFFQSREASNSFYNACPDIVQKNMDTFATLTGRQYHIFEYIGSPNAEHIIISMGSSTETIETTIKHLNKTGEKLGLIKVRLFRPFSAKHLLNALPKTCKSIAVLDSTKEPGSTGEPLYLDVLQATSSAFQNKKLKQYPKIIGGRYGLSSKAFTPAMVYAIFKNLKQEQPKNNFTIGIQDDVTNLSLDYPKNFTLTQNHYQAIFIQNKNKSATQQFETALKLIGENKFVQGYTECNYKKSNTEQISHLRISDTPIKAPYLIDQADVIACENKQLVLKDNTLKLLKNKGILLINTSLSPKVFWETIPQHKQQLLLEKDITIYVVNFEKLAPSFLINDTNIARLFACFFAINKDLGHTPELNMLHKHIMPVTPLYSNKATTKEVAYDSEFSNTLLGRLLNDNGNTIPVSLLPPDGTYPTNTSKHNPIRQENYIPEWEPDACTQCGACSMACPQGSLRIKVFEDVYLDNAPSGFKTVQTLESEWQSDLPNYSIHINPEQCNSCNHCVDACPVKALKLIKKDHTAPTAQEHWNHFEHIPELDRNIIDSSKLSQQQLQEPLFKYATGVVGCGEAPYLKLMSQLFGDRLLIANATGASSIFGGALPTTPWAKNKDGRGPAWSNSLFEDNAEFGLGYRLTLDQKEKQARQLLETLIPYLDFELVYKILNAKQDTEQEINEQRSRINLLKQALKNILSSESEQLKSIADALVKKSVWIVGGDGWAYDIGFGGLDHVLASQKNVNILVLDNEVYDNTGGQASKATPYGAQAAFAYNGKQKQKKDLGLLAMQYKNVYVASVAIGADREQTLKAFNEAESYEGPSIIIAYCHSTSHGIDMKFPSQYHQAAVNSGQWLLYRNDPRKRRALQLDSKRPSIKLENYLKMEQRFFKLLKNNQNIFPNLITEYQNSIDKKYNTYLKLASLPHYTSSKLLQNERILKQLTIRK